MMISRFDTGDYPIYIAPEFEEIVTLAKSKPDTLRLCIEEKESLAIVASGYGNTHDSICKTAKALLGLSVEPSGVLHRERGFWEFSDTENFINGDMHIRLEKAYDYLDESVIDMIKEFIKVYDSLPSYGSED